MARKRQLDPAFWTSEQIVKLTHTARLMFIGMISNADDAGRLKGSPAYLKMAMFPGDRMSDRRIQTIRDEITAIGLALLYADTEGNELLWLPKWHKHQYMNRSYASKLPAHPADTGKDTGQRKGHADPI